MTLDITNEPNLKSLFDKRQNDSIAMVVKQEQTGNVKQVTGGSKIIDTYALFLKESFQNLMDATYIPPAMKQQYRQEAIDAGILSAPSHIA